MSQGCKSPTRINLGAFLLWLHAIDSFAFVDSCVELPVLLDSRRLDSLRPIARCELRLFLAAKTLGNFAQLFVLLLPARLERRGENLVEMIAIIDGRVKKNHVAPVFDPA